MLPGIKPNNVSSAAELHFSRYNSRWHQSVRDQRSTTPTGKLVYVPRFAGLLLVTLPSVWVRGLQHLKIKLSLQIVLRSENKSEIVYDKLVSRLWEAMATTEKTKTLYKLYKYQMENQEVFLTLQGKNKIEYNQIKLKEKLWMIMT